jgi:hypothetical protein
VIDELVKAMAAAIKAGEPRLTEVQASRGLQTMQSGLALMGNVGGATKSIGMRTPAAMVSALNFRFEEGRMDGRFKTTGMFACYIFASGDNREATAFSIAEKVATIAYMNRWNVPDATVSGAASVSIGVLNLPTLNAAGLFGSIVGWQQSVTFGVKRVHPSTDPEAITVLPDDATLVTDGP